MKKQTKITCEMRGSGRVRHIASSIWGRAGKAVMYEVFGFFDSFICSIMFLRRLTFFEVFDVFEFFVVEVVDVV